MPEISLFNSLGGTKTPLRTLEPNKVGLYVCGITVYDLCHIGHARVMVSFDVIARYLKHRGYEVTYIRNITDVDDKIFARAAERGVDFKTLTDEMIGLMHQDFETLGCLAPDKEPRATEYVDEMLALMNRLVERGAAYQGSGGDLYFRVSAFNDYGKLNNRSIEEMQAGARVEVSSDKEHPGDFVLWKSAKPGEASWPSPWGDGRPGWHIECSAMSMSCLGETFDIHGGGPDLKFPHHENEIAQSEAATCKTYANYWMHAGAVRVDNEKMSKSLGNFFTIRQVLEHYNPEVIRFFLLSSQYRGHINYSDQALEQACESLTRIYRALRVAQPDAEPCAELLAKFDEAMSDDFNTPGALAVVFDAVKRINTQTDAPEASAAIRKIGEILGLFGQNPETFAAKVSSNDISDEEIEALIQERAEAKKNRDFATADEIRDRLKASGVEIEDSREGTRWSRI